MSRYKTLLLLTVAAAAAILFISCSASDSNNAGTTATTTVTPPPKQSLTLVSRPQKIADLMAARGQQDQATPTLKIVAPAKDATINGSTVEVKLDLSGDLKGYMPHKDPATGKLRSLADYRDQMREITKQGLVDIMLMLSVRSFQIPPTPLTFAWPPSLPS